MALLNFRDVATGSSSGPLRAGRLFRSAQPYHLDESDLDVVSRSGVRTIIDLREVHEQVPPDWGPVQATGVRVVRVPLADQILPSADEAGPPQERTPDSDSVPEGHQILARFYRAIVDLAGVRLAEVMSVVAGDDGLGGPFLVHCAAGKDRTGTAVALLLKLIGTDTDTIVADYVATELELDAVLTQLTGETREQRSSHVGIPPGISDAPEVAIRSVLDHIDELGGAETVLLRNTDQATLDRVVSALTG